MSNEMGGGKYRISATNATTIGRKSGNQGRHWEGWEQVRGKFVEGLVGRRLF